MVIKTFRWSAWLLIAALADGGTWAHALREPSPREGGQITGLEERLRQQQQPLHVLRGHSGALWAAAFSPSGELISAGEDVTMRFWDPGTGQQVRSVRIRAGVVGTASLTLERNWIVCATLNNSVAVLDMRDPSKPRNFLLRYPSASKEGLINRSLCVGKLAGETEDWVSISADGVLRIWNLDRETLETQHSMVRPDRTEPDRISAAVIDAPRNRAVAATSGDEVWLWEFSKEAAPRPVRQLNRGAERGVVSALALSGSGKLVAIGIGNDRIELRRAASGALARRLERQHDGMVTALAFSRNEKLVASADSFGKIALWEAATGRHLGSRIGHSGIVAALAFSADGNRLATAGWDKTVKLWDVPSIRAGREEASEEELLELELELTGLVQPGDDRLREGSVVNENGLRRALGNVRDRTFAVLPEIRRTGLTDIFVLDEERLAETGHAGAWLAPGGTLFLSRRVLQEAPELMIAQALRTNDFAELDQWAAPPEADEPPADAPPTDAPPADAPPADAPPTDAVSVDAPPDDVPVEEAAPEDVPAADVPAPADERPVPVPVLDLPAAAGRIEQPWPATQIEFSTDDPTLLMEIMEPAMRSRRVQRDWLRLLERFFEQLVKDEKVDKRYRTPAQRARILALDSFRALTGSPAVPAEEILRRVRGQTYFDRAVQRKVRGSVPDPHLKALTLATVAMRCIEGTREDAELGVPVAQPLDDSLPMPEYLDRFRQRACVDARKKGEYLGAPAYRVGFVNGIERPHEEVSPFGIKSVLASRQFGQEPNILSVPDIAKALVENGVRKVVPLPSDPNAAPGVLIYLAAPYYDRHSDTKIQALAAAVLKPGRRWPAVPEIEATKPFSEMTDEELIAAAAASAQAELEAVELDPAAVQALCFPESEEGETRLRKLEALVQAALENRLVARCTYQVFRRSSIPLYVRWIGRSLRNRDAIRIHLEREYGDYVRDKEQERNRPVQAQVQETAEMLEALIEAGRALVRFGAPELVGDDIALARVAGMMAQLAGRGKEFELNEWQAFWPLLALAVHRVPAGYTLGETDCKTFVNRMAGFRTGLAAAAQAAEQAAAGMNPQDRAALLAELNHAALRGIPVKPEKPFRDASMDEVQRVLAEMNSRLLGPGAERAPTAVVLRGTDAAGTLARAQRAILDKLTEGLEEALAPELRALEQAAEQLRREGTAADPVTVRLRNPADAAADVQELARRLSTVGTADVRIDLYRRIVELRRLAARDLAQARAQCDAMIPELQAPEREAVVRLRDRINELLNADAIRQVKGVEDFDPAQAEFDETLRLLEQTRGVQLEPPLAGRLAAAREATCFRWGETLAASADDMATAPALDMAAAEALLQQIARAAAFAQAEPFAGPVTQELSRAGRTLAERYRTDLLAAVQKPAAGAEPQALVQVEAGLRALQPQGREFVSPLNLARDRLRRAVSEATLRRTDAPRETAAAILGDPRFQADLADNAAIGDMLRSVAETGQPRRNLERIRKRAEAQRSRGAGVVSNLFFTAVLNILDYYGKQGSGSEEGLEEKPYYPALLGRDGSGFAALMPGKAYVNAAGPPVATADVKAKGQKLQLDLGDVRTYRGEVLQVIESVETRTRQGVKVKMRVFTLQRTDYRVPSKRQVTELARLESEAIDAPLITGITFAPAGEGQPVPLVTIEIPADVAIEERLLEVKTSLESPDTVQLRVKKQIRGLEEARDEIALKAAQVVQDLTAEIERVRGYPYGFSRLLPRGEVVIDRYEGDDGQTVYGAYVSVSRATDRSGFHTEGYTCMNGALWIGREAERRMREAGVPATVIIGVGEVGIWNTDFFVQVQVPVPGGPRMVWNFSATPGVPAVGAEFGRITGQYLPGEWDQLEQGDGFGLHLPGGRAVALPMAWVPIDEEHAAVVCAGLYPGDGPDDGLDVPMTLSYSVSLVRADGEPETPLTRRINISLPKQSLRAARELLAKVPEEQAFMLFQALGLPMFEGYLSAASPIGSDAAAALPLAAELDRVFAEQQSVLYHLLAGIKAWPESWDRPVGKGLEEPERFQAAFLEVAPGMEEQLVEQARRLVKEPARLTKGTPPKLAYDGIKLMIMTYIEWMKGAKKEDPLEVFTRVQEGLISSTLAAANLTPEQIGGVRAETTTQPGSKYDKFMRDLRKVTEFWVPFARLDRERLNGFIERAAPSVRAAAAGQQQPLALLVEPALLESADPGQLQEITRRFSEWQAFPKVRVALLTPEAVQASELEGRRVIRLVAELPTEVPENTVQVAGLEPNQRIPMQVLPAVLAGALSTWQDLQGRGLPYVPFDVSGYLSMDLLGFTPEDLWEMMTQQYA